MLVPGVKNTISIPVNGLYRGEAGARKLGIKRNIDVNQIHFFSIAFQGRGRDGRLYLDNLRLSKGEGGGALPKSVPAATPTHPACSRSCCFCATSFPFASPDRLKVRPTLCWMTLKIKTCSARIGSCAQVIKPQVVSDHKIPGSNALKVHPGNSYLLDEPQADWRGYEALGVRYFQQHRATYEVRVCRW